jgi:TRAP-type C4-dicarboxylate transport system permease small subunit
MIGMIVQLYRIIAWVNSLALRIGKSIAWVALALMVVVILLQVFFRYVMNSALPWPDEAARFLMLWMTGLIAPVAYRSGGFVAIDMLERALPKRIGSILALVLLVISTLVLITAIRFGWAHTMGFGGNFESASLRLPLDWIGMAVVKVKLRYMYASLLVCVIVLLSVNIELIIRTFLVIIRPDINLPDPDADRLIATGAS